MTNVKLAALLSARPFVLIAALASGVFASCARDPVERELVGSWQTAISSPAGAWQVRFTTLSNGQYRTEFQGPFPMPAETGYFTARSGEWRIEKITGSIDEGTYEFLTDDSVLLQSAAGAVVWNRIATSASSPAAPAVSDAFAPGLPPGACARSDGRRELRVASAQAGGAPSAELLATGPFGAALLEAPAATSPSPAGAFGTVPTTSPFGTPAPPPAPFGVVRVRGRWRLGRCSGDVAERRLFGHGAAATRWRRDRCRPDVSGRMPRQAHRHTAPADRRRRRRRRASAVGGERAGDQRRTNPSARRLGGRRGAGSR